MVAVPCVHALFLSSWDTAGIDRTCLMVSCVGCGARLHHLFSPRKFVTIHTPPDFFATVIIGVHQSAVSPAGTGSMIPILTAAFSSSLAKFLNETGMLYGVMTFVVSRFPI